MLAPTFFFQTTHINSQRERTSMIFKDPPSCTKNVSYFWCDVATVLFFKPSFDEVSTVLNSSVVRASSTAYRGSPPIVRTGGLRV